jgi:hypothetical protein
VPFLPAQHHDAYQSTQHTQPLRTPECSIDGPHLGGGRRGADREHLLCLEHEIAREHGLQLRERGARALLRHARHDADNDGDAVALAAAVQRAEVAERDAPLGRARRQLGAARGADVRASQQP